MPPAASPDAAFPHAVTARLWEPIQPIDRGDRYEDPLSVAFQERAIGTVDGGGSSLNAESEIEFAEIELHLADLDDGLRAAKLLLEEFGAPVGSEFLFHRDGKAETVPFGVTECLAIYLDGATLPDEVYAQSDINDLVEQFDGAVSPGGGHFRSYWEGPTETALYLYGANAEDLLVVIQPVLDSYPLCQNARVVVRHGNPALDSRTVRIPRR